MAAEKRTRDTATVNRYNLLTSVDGLQIDEFEEAFSLDDFNIIPLYYWVKEPDIPEKHRIVSRMTEKAARHAAERPTPKRVIILAHSNESWMQEMGTD